MIDGITGKYTRAPTLYRIALMTRPPKFQQMADAITAATITAVDRHLAHLGLYPRSDSAGLAPVAPLPPDGRVLWTPPHTPPLPYSILLRPLLPYSTLPRASPL